MVLSTRAGADASGAVWRGAFAAAVAAQHRSLNSTLPAELTRAAPGTVKRSDKPSERAPDAAAFAKLVAAGTVVPDEASKPHEVDKYHKNVIGAARGYKEVAGYKAWFARNREAVAKQTGWDRIDFDSEDAPDPTWLLVYGVINGTGCQMQLFRPTVIEAQRAMRKEYGAARETARAQRGAVAMFKRIEHTDDRSGKVAQWGGAALTILELYEGALTALPELWRFGEQVAEASGEQDVEVSWDIKKPVRIWFKLATKYDGDVSKVIDCARISVVLRSVEAYERALLFVLPRAATFKNHIREPTPELYIDCMFTIEIAGHVCEVQLHLAEMMLAKHSGGGHNKYKMCRQVLQNPIVERNTYCHEVSVSGELVGEGERNVKGEEEGRGTMVYANGNMHAGDWKAGVKEGQGTFSFATSNKFVGEFRSGKMEGQGTFYGAKGDKHVGEYKADTKEDHGTYYFTHGDKHVGEYNEGKKEGQGTYYAANGDKYVGGWRSGKKEGQGTYYYALGDKYDGYWKADKMDGKGTYYSANGNADVGCFAGGRDVGEGARWSADRQTAWRLQDGTPVKEISLEEASAIAGRVGLPVPGV